MMIPRTVRAPSNAPITKYRRMIGPTFVISSYSRIRRRQAPRSMSSARNPKFLADGPFESLGGGPGLVDVREACLREVRLPPSLTAEFRRDRLHDLGDVDADIGPAGDDETHIVRRLGPEDRGRPGLRSDRLGHRHHKPDPFRDLLFHEGPGHPRRLDGLPGFRRRLLVRRPLREFPQLLPLGHDSFSGGDELVRGNSEDLRRSLDFFGLLPNRIERTFSRGIFEAHDAILDARRPEQLDERDVARAGDVRPATRLHIPFRDLDYAQLPARHGAALIESEAELPLCEIAGQELGANLSRRQDLIVR